MVRVCAFPGCFNREKALRLRPQGSAHDESLTFHTLPLQDPERLKLWLLALHRDINSPVESIRALRVCSEHFSPDDFPGPNRRYLKSTAVPVQLVVPTEARYTGAELQMEGRYDVNMDSECQNDFSFVTGSPGATLKLEGGISASSQSTEAFSPLSCTSAAGFPLDSEDSTEAEMKSDSQESLMEGHRVKLQKDMKQEDEDLRLYHDKRVEATSEQRKDKQTDEEENEDREMNTEDTAQCSEELVITKVEDVTSEMPIDVDYTGDHSGRMEVDESEYAETQTAKDDKNKMESFGTNTKDNLKNVGNRKPRKRILQDNRQTQPVVRIRRLPVVQPSVDLLVKIKDEPIDDECSKTPQSPMGNLREDEDFTQTPDEITIRPAFPVGGNATSIGATAATTAKAPSIPAVSIPKQTPLSAIVMVCAGCKRIILKGKTAFQRSGSPKLYCSPQCLCITSAIEVKKKTCHHCLKEISHPKDVLLASVDTSGTTKEFCSQKCISAFNFRCSVCQRTSVTHGHEVKSMGTVHKLCSDVCFNQFLSSNKLTMNCCMNCGGYCRSTDGSCPTLQIEGNTVKFCTQKCLKVYKKRSLKTATCKMCHTKRPSAEMVVSQNSEGEEELFCSDSCATTYSAQTLSSSGIAVECKNCKKKQVPQYHLTMSEGTNQNFCSFTCVVSYEAVINKKKAPKQTKKITSTSNYVPAPKPVAPRPAPVVSSSSVKTVSSSGPGQTVTRLPCAQCLQSFSHKPKLLEFKKKMYVFCYGACVEDFEKTKNIAARCESCRTVQFVKSVKRINKVERTFCGQKCKVLFEDNLANVWGEKYCRDCFYCGAGSKTLVTGNFNDKQEEFCGTQCLSKYTSLIRQEIKCSMCRQGRKMNETVKWLDEMKHFCNLRCLMFFCSLQAVTGAVTKAANKSLPKRGGTPVSSTVDQSSKETTPVIANVISLSSEANGQSDVLESTDVDDSVHPSITVEVPEEESVPEKMVSTQKRTVKTSASPHRNQKSKALSNNTKNKAAACKPNTRNAETQCDEIPKVIVLPVPVPVYVPIPMNLYTQYVPQTVGLPLPVPVPMFLPTTLDSAEHIVKTIQEIKEKIPDDPLEADLIMMAEMVAEDAEKDKNITASDQKSNVAENLDSEDLSSNLSWEEDSVSSAQTLDQTQELEKAQSKSAPELKKARSKSAPELEKALSKSVSSINPSSQIPTPIPTEPRIDLEADLQIEDIELFKEQKHNNKELQVSYNVKQKLHRKGSDGIPQKKRVSKSGASASSHGPANISKMQHENGVSAWMNWVCWRNSQPHVETPKFGARTMTLKEDLLKCSTAELSYGLSKFISEVRRPNGENYTPDSVFYLCLGIQQHLFKNNRMENIFADVCYSRFCQDMTNMLKEWTPTILPSGYVHCRVEEKYLWDCKQLGAFSPGVLLNTLLYFFTKFFNYKTVEQHRRLSFGHFKRYCRGKSNSKVVYLHFYPHKEDTSTDGVPAKKRKKEDERGKALKIKENTDNPFRCPVRLFEFYLSKCSPSVRHSTSQFYLTPERSCVPSSPTWFSTSSLSDDALENMLARILTVRELYMQEDKSAHETEFDSDSD